MHFEILDHISDVETFAAGSGIREIARLRRLYERADGESGKGSLPESVAGNSK